MRTTILTLALGLSLAACAGEATDSVTLELKNARRTVTYHAALLVDGETLTLKNETLSATEGNQIAALVVNGGKLVLDHCTIEKTGDGLRTGGRQGGGPQTGGGERPGRPDGENPQMGEGRPERPNGGEPQMGEGRPPKPEGDSIQRGGERPEPRNGEGPAGSGRPQRPGGQGGPGGGGGDDGFNFYGLNWAVVAIGEGSEIELIGCTVHTDAEYANAVFSCDEAHITISEGININTQKGSSRGLFATCAGVITASGPVNIDTKGPHCAPLATDRGGGTVTVGSPGTTDKSQLNAAGEGSPCIYSTGDISAYNATGSAAVSQTMVIEGKNTITIENCDFTGHSPQHGGIMLYQSTSGDASVGTSELRMRNCTIRDNSGTAMILVTNTHSIVEMEACTLLDPQGNAIGADYPLVTCRNCNTDGHHWGREGSNGGQIDITLKRQTLTGTLLANEAESAITLTADSASDISGLQTAQGSGSVEIK